MKILVLCLFATLSIEAKHAHAAWREVDGDFRHDILAEHLQQEH